MWQRRSKCGRRRVEPGRGRTPELRQTILLIVLLAVCAGVVAASSSARATQTKVILGGRGEPGTRDLATRFSANGGATWANPSIVATHPNWASPLSGTHWISFNATGVSPQPYPKLSRYLFETSFYLPAGFSNPSLVVRVMADNSAAVFVNGKVFGSQPCCVSSNFESASTFTDTTASHFKRGKNTLRIVLGDFGVVGALDYSARLTWNG